METNKDNSSKIIYGAYCELAIVSKYINLRNCSTSPLPSLSCPKNRGYAPLLHPDKFTKIYHIIQASTGGGPADLAKNLHFFSSHFLVDSNIHISSSFLQVKGELRNQGGIGILKI